MRCSKNIVIEILTKKKTKKIYKKKIMHKKLIFKKKHDIEVHSEPPQLK